MQRVCLNGNVRLFFRIRLQMRYNQVLSVVPPNFVQMRNLVVDIGNSRVKAAVFEGEALVADWAFSRFGQDELKEIFGRFPDIDRSLLSCTGDEGGTEELLLGSQIPFFLKFRPGIPVPVRNFYSTPLTLGCDRMAAAVGAAGMFPGRDVFIVDLGSAITEDIVTADRNYLGGSISPGMAMRFRSLAQHTVQLPVIERDAWEEYDPGKIPSSTRDALISGVVGGVEMELRGRMEDYSRLYPGLVTIFTGGDAPFFEKRFKNTIFANYELVLRGLNIILNYNADKKDSI